MLFLGYKGTRLINVPARCEVRNNITPCDTCHDRATHVIVVFFLARRGGGGIIDPAIVQAK